MEMDDLHPAASEFLSKHSSLFDKHFPPDLDDESMVLKAHLLLEAALRDFTSNLVAHPQHLDGARFRFTQVLSLAKALCPHDFGALNDLVWTCAKHLNDLRNTMAHELEPDPSKIAKQQKVIVDVVNARRRANNTAPTDLRGALAYLFGSTHALFETVLSRMEAKPSE
ncbi:MULTISPECIES: hypothetical protein [Pseudomonas]|uniref:DUF4145 domain-containing protein n=1 Tax=Pseudomonas mosselii TaxID=78327 RepID=A0A7W2PWK9_9PSED|nr:MULTISPECIES: hypothetical protein [Pseudomonas]MBA6063532.1 hypothetical protein [Pseudomonas mosselii]CRI54837.1 hypothetical protein CCOS191_0301 [Pseudomonas sp. CCOS 191]